MASLPIVVKYLIVFFISMVPIVELRGAIPIAESLKLSISLYYPIAIIGNMLPVPIIYLFARKVLEWGKNKKIIGKFFTWCLEKGEKGGEKLKASAGNSGIFWAVPFFVVQAVLYAIQPVLGTLVYGALVKAGEKYFGRLIFAGAGVAQNNVDVPV